VPTVVLCEDAASFQEHVLTRERFKRFFDRLDVAEYRCYRLLHVIAFFTGRKLNVQRGCCVLNKLGNSILGISVMFSFHVRNTSVYYYSRFRLINRDCYFTFQYFVLLVQILKFVILFILRILEKAFLLFLGRDKAYWGQWWIFYKNKITYAILFLALFNEYDKPFAPILRWSINLWLFLTILLKIRIFILNIASNTQDILLWWKNFNERLFGADFPLSRDFY